MAIIPGAEPFFFPGGSRGALLIHGFTGSPSEMRLLGEDLHTRGYTVLGPRLCGHGTSEADLAQTGWLHWYSAVEDGYHLLKSLCRDVYVAGLSMGGLLALKLAAEYPVARVASLSAPIFLADKRLPLLPIYRLFRGYVPKRRRKMDVADIYNVAYGQTPLSSLNSLLELIKQVDGLLPAIAAPALVMQSRSEHTVLPASASHIYERLGSQEKELAWLDRSGHVITLDIEREQVYQAIGEFFAGGNSEHEGTE
ncbi:MAG TPA: alpha/beta fold hydrolase [Selenomonadales bacterium]|nr:alpha/beta fold hydrolase [Selenomonadales bacterium]